LFRLMGPDEQQRLFENTEGWAVGPLSADERWLALARTRTTNDNDLYLHDLQTRNRLHLSPHEGDARYSAADFSPDSKHLLYLTNEGGEFTGLRRYDIESGAHARVQDEPWDIVHAAYSHDGKFRVSAINDDGSTRVSIVEVASGAPVALPV
ncbi:MAG TPA: hypothetical protein PKO41_10790, partial [Dokdonella sp.]|nr:hypothetical protein [Dokdonella sp.]